MKSLHSFRIFHMKVVLNYLSEAEKGTGNSEFRILLNKFKENTVI